MMGRRFVMKTVQILYIKNITDMIISILNCITDCDYSCTMDDYCKFPKQNYSISN